MIDYKDLFASVPNDRKSVAEAGKTIIEMADGNHQLKSIGRSFVNAARWAEKEHNLSERRYELEQRRKEKAAASGFKPYMRKKKPQTATEIRAEITQLERLLATC